MKRGYVFGHMFCIAHRKENPMINFPQDLGSTWMSGGIGLVAGFLLRYCILRVLIVFKLFGRTWTLDLKDNDHQDPS